MHRLLAVAVLTFASTAFAAGEKMEAPKPNAMLETAFKDAVGSWTCKGTWNDPSGKTMTATTKAKFTKELDGHQYAAVFDMPKSDAMPAMKSHAEWHYDPISKGLVGTMVCSSGDVSRATSSGQQGTSIVWTSEGTMMGQPMKMRSTHTWKSPKEMTMVHEVEAGGNWAKMGEDTCKKN